MAAPYPASIAMVSSGSLLFSDASQPWDPSQFPTLPPVNLALTAQGTAATGNVSTLTLTNSNIYEPFEPPSVQSQLLKQFQINQAGLVTFSETKLGFVSTMAAAFAAAVSQFQPAAIGGADIQDVLTGTPDTLTNAVGKLDAWIANAFLFQPPAVQPVADETNSMWGGVRWNTFNTYNVLNDFVPYVTSIIIIVGDPASSDYCTLEITDPTFFPYKTYTDGLSPQQNPLVALRVFTDFLPAGQQTYYTRKQLQTQCIRVVSEAGDATFPAAGNVASFVRTDGASTYTTLSLFLPLLPLAYPTGTSVPVSIAYVNNTAGQIHVTQTSTRQATTGGPSAPATLAFAGAAANEVDLQIRQPVYSDANAGTTEPFFSSYTASYSYTQLAVANVAQIGFQYGTPSAAQVPSTLSTYVGNVYEHSFVATNSTQTLALTPLPAGVVWSTTAYATNAALKAGADAAGPLVSTLFPSVASPTLDGVALAATDPEHVTAAAFAAAYQGAGLWSVGPAVGHDILFLSTVAPLAFAATSTVQYNDASYPGDRNAIQVEVTQTDSVGNSTVPVTLVTTPTDDDYALAVPYSAAANAAAVVATLQETQTVPGYEHYFYAAQLSGSVSVSTLTDATQSVQLTLAHTTIPSFAGSPVPQTNASAPYVFSTEFSGPAATTGLWPTDVQDGIQISGIPTPTPLSLLRFDMSGVNFAYRYAASTFSQAQLFFQGDAVGPLAGHSTNVAILQGGSPVTTLPFPANAVLTLSSLAVQAYEDVYTNPNGVDRVQLVAAVTPLNPAAPPAPLAVPLASYIDTVSYPFLGNFIDATGTHGLRIVSLLPNVDDLSTSQYFMDDGIAPDGTAGAGLDVAVSTFVTVTLPSTVQFASTILYDNTQAISSIYTDYYSRELLFTNGYYIHPVGYNFTAFGSGVQYPNFETDLVDDTTFGNRYATFAFEGPVLSTPTVYSFMNIRLNQPSLLSTIQATRAVNDWWPDEPVNRVNVSSMKVRMHAKLLGTYDVGTTQTFETAWINAFKQMDLWNFDDGVFDQGGAYSVSTLVDSGDVEYKVQINRRLYAKTTMLVRVGIARDGGQYTDRPITFQGIQGRLSEV